MNYPNFQNLMLLRRVHATAINFPCITTLHLPNSTCTQVHLYFITYNSIRKPMDLILSPSLQQGVSGRRIVNGRSVSARIMCGQFKGIANKLEDTYRVNQKIEFFSPFIVNIFLFKIFYSIHYTVNPRYMNDRHKFFNNSEETSFHSR